MQRTVDGRLSPDAPGNHCRSSQSPPSPCIYTHAIYALDPSANGLDFDACKIDALNALALTLDAAVLDIVALVSAVLAAVLSLLPDAGIGHSV